MSRYISFITLLVVIGLLIALFYKVMAGFFVPLFLAALLVVIFRPVHLWIVERFKGRLKLAALLTTVAIMLCVFVPMAILFVLAAFESQQLVKSLDKATLIRSIKETREKLNLTLPELAEDLKSIEIRLENISEMERLEDINYLGEPLLSVSFYNSDLANKLGEDESVTDSWKAYLSAFDGLKNIQSKIANRDELENPDDQEPESQSSAMLLHDFHQQRNESNERFAEFKVQALGGSPFWIWLREMANPTPELLEEYGSSAIGYARSFLVGLGTTTTSFLGRLLLGASIMIISLYFFLLDGPAMLESLKNLSPIDDEHEQELIVEFGKVSRAVVVATLLAALVQALLGGIGYYFAGLESVFLLTLLTGCLALVPFVGAAAVWVPCALWLYFVDNNVPAATGLAVYGVVIVSMSDNFIKPMVLHGQSNIHPLFALLSVLGGVAALGPIGILIGPMIVAFLQTLLKILQQEVSELESAAEPSKSTG